MKVNVELDNHEEREAYLEELEEVVRNGHYPECSLDLPHALVDAEFVSKAASTEGCDEFAAKVREMIDKALEPVATIPELKEDEDVSEYQWTVIDANHAFMESIGAFTQVDGEIVRGGDVANEFILAEDIDEAHEALWEFHEWFADDLEQLAEKMEGVDGYDRHYEINEFRETALFNGCLILVLRRREENPFADEEMRTP